ncbi:hypothetical protein [Sphingomonas lycopersici]|uniref:Uncharacterized protein n=1 Tax=Sphingomonas lycopersici TaxID=2951807 RepID=A0AA41ZCN5_9SPHN|nr:hypothetical protein [Sphingomonas lycopersici]MCW6536716.1 hypothetical protein [Sphingomonas lycopersici]
MTRIKSTQISRRSLARVGLAISALSVLVGCKASATDALGYHIEMMYLAGGKVGSAWVEYRCMDLGPQPFGVANRALDEKTVRTGGSGPLGLTLSWDWLYRGAPCPPTYAKRSANQLEADPPVIVLEDHGRRATWFVRSVSVKVPKSLSSNYTITKFSVQRLADQKEGRPDGPADYRALPVFAPFVELVFLPESNTGMPATRSHPLWKWLSGQSSRVIAICDIAHFRDIMIGLQRKGIGIDCGQHFQSSEKAAAVQLVPRFLDYSGSRVWQISGDGGGAAEATAAISINHPDCSTRGADTMIWTKCIGKLKIDDKNVIDISENGPPILAWRQSDGLLFLVSGKSKRIFEEAMGERK